MFSFQICVIALWSLHLCHTMITLEYIRNLQRTESKYMKLVFLDGTCYTDATMRCVGIPDVELDYEKYGVMAPFTVTERLRNNILFTENSLTVSGQLPDSFMAFVLINYSGRVVGKSLIDVVQDCVSKERYVEAFIWLMNVIESVGISMLWKLCYTLNILLARPTMYRMTDHFEMINRLIAYIENTFKTYFISTEPVRQIVAAINVVKVNDRIMRVRQEFLNNTFTEYTQRYGNMVGLVNTGIFEALENVSSNYRFTIELQHTLSRALDFFKTDTDDELISGGEADILNQLNSEEINRQL